MLSRVADSIYWMNRYIERAENVARFISVNLILTLDLPDEMHEQWMPLVMTTGDSQLFQEKFGKATKENIVNFLTFDTQNPNSLLSCLTAARENARSVREIISSEMWECVNRFYLSIKDGASTHAIENSYDFFTQVKLSSHLFVGIVDSTMAHSEGWHFGRLGRMLERADKTSRLVDVKYYILLPTLDDVGTPYDDIQWAAVLKSASAFEMYRKARRHGINPIDVVDFLILDRQFPRSIYYSISRAEESLHRISGTPITTVQNDAEKKMGRLRSDLNYTDIKEIMAFGLHEFLDDFQAKLNGVGESVYETFFALRPVQSQQQQQGFTSNGDLK
jgi:uncharacterized alpha-E superfamily protein